MAKLTHTEVQYEHPAQAADHCETCRHFLGVNNCELVRAPIRPEDWCNRFRRSMSLFRRRRDRPGR